MSPLSPYCLAQHQELSWRSTPTCSRARWRPRTGRCGRSGNTRDTAAYRQLRLGGAVL